MEIKIKTIPHNTQRYPTVGDYIQQQDNSWYISVSETGNDKYNFLIALHEFIELYLTQLKGIKECDITAFDLYYEKCREMKLVNEDSEPGFATNAPYRKEHTIATAIEMMIAAELGIDWLEYDRKISEL
jgi:hypothetical protein